MNCVHCFCCCFIRNRKAVIRRPLAIKYWDDPEEIEERPQTPDAPIKRKKRANLMGGITNLKHSTRRLQDDEGDDEGDDDDEDNDDDDDEVDVLLEEGVKKASIFYYLGCFRSKNIKTTVQKEKKKKIKKKRKKLKAEKQDIENDEETPAVDDSDNNNEIEKTDEDNDETNDEETKATNDIEDMNETKGKDPKVDAYKEKKRLRKLQKEQARLQKKVDEEEAARLAAMAVVEEVEEEYSKYHSVQHFPLGTSLLDVAAEQEKFKIETKKWRTYKRRQDKKALKANGWEDRIILNSGCPKEFVPEGYVTEELAPPALDLKYINHRKVMFHWYDDELKPPVHGWFQGIICSAKKHGFNFCIKYDLDITKNKHVNGVIGTILSLEGENAYGLRWSILKPANSNGDIYTEDLKFTDNNGDDNDETKNE